MTPQQCMDAYALLCERSTLVDLVQKLLSTRRFRIEFETPQSCKFDTHRVPPEFGRGPVLRATTELRRLIVSDTLEQLAGIDKQLRACGIEPPTDEVAP